MRKILLLLACLPILLLSCHNAVEDVEPVIYKSSPAPALDKDDSIRMAIIASNPSIFGNNCMYFSDEDEMNDLLDSLSEMSGTGLSNWASMHGLSNPALASNIAYASAFEDVESKLGYSFDAVKDSTLLCQMEKALFGLFDAMDSTLISITTTTSGKYYEPKHSLSRNCFYNQEGLFVVGNDVYYLSPDFDEIIFPFMGEDEKDSKDSCFLQLTRTVIEMYIKNYLDIAMPPYYNNYKDPYYFSDNVENEDYKVCILVRTQEIARYNNRGKREDLLHIKSFHKSKEGDYYVPSPAHCRGTIFVEMASYRGNYNDIYHHVFNKHNKCFKDKSYTHTRNYDNRYYSFLNLSALSIDFYNEHHLSYQL